MVRIPIQLFQFSEAVLPLVQLFQDSLVRLLDPEEFP